MCYGKYHNSWEIFLVVHTRQYTNKFITRKTIRWTLTDCSQVPYLQLALTAPCPGAYPLQTRWGSHEINADRLHISTVLSLARSNSTLSRNLVTVFTPVRLCDHRNRPGYERHNPVMSIMPLLWASHLCYEHYIPVTSLWRMARNSAHAVPFTLWLPK